MYFNSDCNRAFLQSLGNFTLHKLFEVKISHFWWVGTLIKSHEKLEPLFFMKVSTRFLLWFSAKSLFLALRCTERARNEEFVEQLFFRIEKEDTLESPTTMRDEDENINDTRMSVRILLVEFFVIGFYTQEFNNQ